MMNDPHQKVQASHLKRNAYVYVRQSTLRQVLENHREYQAPVRPAPARGGARLGRRAHHRDRQ